MEKIHISDWNSVGIFLCLEVASVLYLSIRKGLDFILYRFVSVN